MILALCLLLIFATWAAAFAVAPYAARHGELGLFLTLCLGVSGSVAAILLAAA